MCRIIIDSKVSEIDTTTLEIRLENLLQLIGSRFKTLYVSIQMKCEVSKLGLNYRCEVEGVDQDTGRLFASSEDGHLMSAVRSAVIRLGQEAAAKEQPGYGPEINRKGNLYAIGRAV